MESRENFKRAMGDALEKLERLIDLRQRTVRHKITVREELQLRAGEELHIFEEGESLLNEYPGQEMEPEEKDEWLWILRGVVQDLRRAQTYADESLEGAEKSVRILARILGAHMEGLTAVESEALAYLENPVSLRCIGGNIKLDEAAGIES